MDSAKSETIGVRVYLSLCRLSLKIRSDVYANSSRVALSFWICLRWSNKDWEENCTCRGAADVSFVLL